MSRYTPAARPLVQGLRATTTLPFRPAASLSSTATRHETTASTSTSTATTTDPAAAAFEAWQLDPQQTTLHAAEKELMRRGTPPVGSRRRRAALHAAALDGHAPVPFELMPYQCFQEARKVLAADREDKLRQIAVAAAKIRKLEAVVTDPASDLMGFANTSRGGEPYRQRRLASLRQHVEDLKILADINDPQVKRRFEDGLGDMNKPIYRHLAAERWRGRPLRLMEQRIEQFRLAPDLLPVTLLRPRADVELYFRSYHVPPGAIVDSLISEVCPRLRVQVFDRGTRLVTVAVVDPDVPDLEADTFDRRCHFLATNIPLAPTDPSVPLSRLDPDTQVILPWLPAFAQKGARPHRLAVFVLEQRAALPGKKEAAAAAASAPATTQSAPLDAAALRTAFASRDGFALHSFVDKFRLDPIGCTLFRTEWDAGTESVMARAGMPGADVELKAVRYPSLKPPRKARGWEAKHQGPKYRHLWKYTHRIATPKRKFVR